MAEEAPIDVGDRVISLVQQGIFTVTGRRGRFVDIESPRGLRLTVTAESLRRVDGTPAAPRDA
jgi:hypothetical protein